MKKYNSYRDSSIAGIGLIPDEWIVNKFGRAAFFQEGPGLRNWQFKETGIKVICVTNIVPPKIDFSKMVKYISDEEYYESYKHFTVIKGDIMLSSSGASWGKVAEYDSYEPVILNTSTIRLNQNKNNEVFVGFIKWMIQSSYIKEQLDIMLTGSCQPNFGPSHLNELPCVYPKSSKEQMNIAMYLDYKIPQIDKLITDKENLIQLLNEERITTITQSVSKGLNSTKKMIHSGVEWLGEIPEHWKVKKIKYVANLKSGDTITSEVITYEGDYPVYGGNGLRGYYNQYNIDGDYILIGRQGALCGNINYASNKFWASEHAIVCHLNKDYDWIWLGNLLTVMNLNQYSQSAAQPGLAVEKIKNLYIPVPNYDEQLNIGKFIKQECYRIDRLIKKIKKEVEHLKEYKTALISEVITGKIDVRDEIISQSLATA